MKHYKQYKGQHARNFLSSNWTTPLTTDEVKSLLSCMCNDVKTPFAAGLLLCLKFGADSDILEAAKTLDPLNYSPEKVFIDNKLSNSRKVTSYIGDSQITGLIKKYPRWSLPTNPEVECNKKFIASEIRCRTYNLRISQGSLFNDPVVASVTHRAQRIIADLLGDVPTFEQLQFKFGSGVNISVKNNTSAFDKLNSTLDVHPGGFEQVAKLLRTCPGLTGMGCNNILSDRQLYRYFSPQYADRLATVDKDAFTKRGISITGNITSVYQRSLGIEIRKRLLPVIDLKTAQVLHRKLALNASKDGISCTVDSVSASDLICYMIVTNLFPPEWVKLLNAGRVDKYEVDDIVYTYHKYSSMGNGFTFELETLIFYALARASAEYDGVYKKGCVSVYGDDVIAPTASYNTIKTVFDACGFVINDTKSFETGYFRESCGGDYIDGTDVRPFNLKDDLSIRTAVLMHNSIVRKGRADLFPATLNRLRSYIPASIRTLIRGNYIEDDSYLLDINVTYTPAVRMVPITRRRILPNYLSNGSLKAFALYRQLYPNSESVNSVRLNPNRRNAALLYKLFRNDFYDGVEPIDKLVKAQRRIRYHAQVFEHFHLHCTRPSPVSDTAVNTFGDCEIPEEYTECTEIDYNSNF